VHLWFLPDAANYSVFFQKYLLSKYLGCNIDQVVLRIGANGKPMLEPSETTKFALPIFWNTTHTTAFLVIAFTVLSDIGLDLELKVQNKENGRKQKNLKEVVDAFFLDEEKKWLAQETDFETAFLWLWTRKEAMAKCMGHSIFHHVTTSVSAHSLSRDTQQFKMWSWSASDLPIIQKQGWLSLAMQDKNDSGLRFSVYSDKDLEKLGHGIQLDAVQQRR